MTPVVMLAVKAANEPEWRAALTAAAGDAGVALDLRGAEEADPAEVDVLVYAFNGPVHDFRPFTRLKAILNLWAGVEKVLSLPTLPADVPLCRMVEPGLTWGMTDYVVGHVMRHHIGVDAALRGPGAWWDVYPPLARDRKVGILGLGELGGDAARALAGLRFDVAGWSRSPKTIPGVTCLHGRDGFETILARSEILVGLLPRTPATENLLDADAFARMPEGAVIVNAGRGELIDDAALLAALDAGRLAHATLDVFREEPLPEGHPFLLHPRVTVTPHIASATRPETAGPALIGQIGRVARGEPLMHVVDRARGY